jgi:hypothetical protein
MLQSMPGIPAAIRRRPLLAFFALTYLASWTLWFPTTWFADEIPGALTFLLRLLGSLVPSSLAIILTGWATVESVSDTSCVGC